MDLTELEYKELKAKATELGIEIKGNPKREELEVLVEEAIEAADMAAREASYEKPTEESKVETAKVVDKVSARRNAMQVKKVIITPLDNRMKGLKSEMYAVGNKHTGMIKKVVRFNTPSLEPQCVLDLLNEKTMLIQESYEVNGKMVNRHVNVPAFNIKELELTAEELAEIEGKTKK